MYKNSGLNLWKQNIKAALARRAAFICIEVFYVAYTFLVFLCYAGLSGCFLTGMAIRNIAQMFDSVYNYVIRVAVLVLTSLVVLADHL